MRDELGQEKNGSGRSHADVWRDFAEGMGAIRDLRGHTPVAEIKQLIRDLREQGKTIVLSGHLLADMQDICDRIAILHRGELKELGRVSDLLTVQDVTQIKARNLSPAAVDEIRELIQRHGGEDVSVDHPTTTLEELFLRIVRESDLHPGRRKVATDGSRPTPPAPPEFAGSRSQS